VKLKAEKQEEIFLANPFDARLDTHKVSRTKWGSADDGKKKTLRD
jgi:hypothetical protein